MMVMLTKRAGEEASEANMRLLRETSRHANHRFDLDFIVSYEKIQQLRGVEEVRTAKYRTPPPTISHGGKLMRVSSTGTILQPWSNQSSGVQKSVCCRGTRGCQGGSGKQHTDFCRWHNLLPYVVVVMNGRTYNRRVHDVWRERGSILGFFIQNPTVATHEESWCEGEPEGDLVLPFDYLWTKNKK
eukprot:SAG31_NODE_615_length_13521_cov_43.196916_11_plen_186_part_00